MESSERAFVIICGNPIVFIRSDKGLYFFFYDDKKNDGKEGF